MNTAKQIILENTFTSAFEIENFRKFIKEIFNEPEMLPIKRHTGIWREYTDHIVSYTDIARYTDNQGKKLTVLAVELKKDKSVERARSMQRNFISKVLDTNNLDAAIVAFYLPNEKNWRLSFVRLDYSFKEKIELLLTPAKRYSYLVGEGEPNHTAKNQLYPIFADDRHNPSIDEIEKAFSVERVTEEFFKQYKVKYIELKEYLEKDEPFIKESTKLGLEPDKFSEQFAKKLMGQLAFLYFLQKKGWLGVEILPPKDIQSGKRFLSSTELNEIASKQDDKAKEILKNVFRKNQADAYVIDTGILYSLNEHDSDILIQCFKNTKFDNGWDTGSRSFIRDLFTHCIKNTNKNFFNDFLEPLFYDCLNKKRGTSQYYTKFNCKIPFLNGGFFEPLEGYHWKDMRLDIPHTIFSKTVEKNEIADGILDIFDRFNFTINEDEPLEKEVAVDPEMLGKIFENLLDVKDRKSKGAFYTPREIVHYMCQESLCNYLVNEINLDYDEVKDFILFGEIRKDEDCSKNVDLEDDNKRSLPRNIYINLAKIDHALANIKVADPAVGSGAFPLGMLSEIVKLRNIITEYRVHQIPADKKFERKIEYHNRNQYLIKWDTIKNSIFAVDIESSAVDIAKLRLWLSLVVDQEVNTDSTDPFFSNDDKDPHPLPNLDYNIMCGNSLIDEFEGIKLFDDEVFNTGKKLDSHNSAVGRQYSLFNEQMDTLTNRLFAEQEKFFAENDTARKEEIKLNINRTIDAIIRAKLSRDNNQAGLSRYEASLKENTKPYFLWKLEFAKVFKEKGGFDVVIGNPPYVDSENMVKNMPEFRELCTKKYVSAKGNWDLFVLFVELGYINANSKGNVSFIIPNKIIAADYAKSVRTIMANNSISEIRDYSNVNVFKEAAVYPITFISNKLKTNTFVKMVVMNEIEGVAWKNDVAIDIFSKQDKWDSFFAENNKVTEIIDKMLTFPLLGDLSDVRGAATVSEAYEIKEMLTDNIEHSNEYFKFINTGTIDRYKSLWFNNKTQYIKQGYHRPVINKLQLKGKYPKRHFDSENNKIIIGGMTKILECFFDSGEYLAGKSTIIVLKKDIELKYLIGLLNSILLSKFYKVYFNSLSLAGGFFRIGAPQIKQLPIPIPTEQQEKKISGLVNQIISAKQSAQGTDTSVIETEIDKIVYMLYGLTDDEIKIIEDV